MRHIYFILIVVALLTGCQTPLPFSHQVIPVIPDSLKVNGASAKAYAINDFGHVVGVYRPPAPNNGARIFVLADGRLIMHEYPCKGGGLHAGIITNTGLIAGYCAPMEAKLNHSFVFSYNRDGEMQATQPAWPTKGYLVSGMNDRGDAIAKTLDPYHLREPDEIRGFIYVAGKLNVIRKSNSPRVDYFSNAVINASGQVVGGSRVPASTGPLHSDAEYFVFANSKFVQLPSDIQGSVKAANRQGHFVTKVEGRGFGINEEHYREIDCGKEWCTATDINDQGWVVGERHTTYFLPPMGAALGDTFLWANNKFYSIDKSVGMNVDPLEPLKLSNAGHILFHSGGWPYLLAPQGLSRQPAR